MKKICFLLLIVFSSGLSFGQIEFNTGDNALDMELNAANKEAKGDLVAFKQRLLSEHDISSGKADRLLKKMEPAEVLLAGRLKDLLGISIEIVEDSYDRNKDKGWGAIAKDLGIKPGSAQFHALKGKTKKQKNKGKSSEKRKSRGKAKGKTKS